jgi:hypothetical protein
VRFRSEEEQSVGYELFKALRKLKLSSVSPLPSSSNRHESPSSNEAIVIHPKGGQSHHQRRKGKIKFRKPYFKVVRNLLTKKLIVIKKDRWVRDLVEVAMLLETLGVPLYLLLASYMLLCFGSKLFL